MFQEQRDKDRTGQREDREKCVSVLVGGPADEESVPKGWIGGLYDLRSGLQIPGAIRSSDNGERGKGVEGESCVVDNGEREFEGLGGEQGDCFG